MLQIISGKFYRSPERYSTPAKGITFSNYHTVGPISTCVATLEPVDAYSSATGAYVINYVNVIEKPKQAQRIAVIRGGDWVIVRQFEVLCIFGLRAFFDGDRHAVEINCRAKPSQATDLYVPAHYTERFFDPTILATAEDADRFAKFVEKVIGLPRKQYTAVINALETFAHSLEIINYQLDLAYSMLVYSLESLCQSFDACTPVWDDYEDDVRDELDPLLAGIDSTTAQSIKDTLLKAGHLRLRRRLITFATQHIKPSFYVEEAANRTRPVKKSELEQCLTNAYVMRSKYVHQLQPIRSQLRIPEIGKGDVFVWENEPYLTYSGLLRVVYHVIQSFIEAQPTVATEDFIWQQDLPGMVQLQMAPRHWVWNPTTFTPDQARIRLSGSLSMLQGAFADGDPIRLNPTPLLQKIESMLGQGKENDRSAMLALYSTLIHFIKPENRPSGCDTVTQKYKAVFQRCCIEMLLVWMITEDSTWPWTAAECSAVLETYRRTKFKKNSIAVPTLFEMCLYAEVANRFLEEGKLDGYEKWCDAALFEAPSISVLQEYIISTKASKGKLDPQQIITLRKGFSPPDDAAVEPSQTEGQPAESGSLAVNQSTDVGTTAITAASAGADQGIAPPSSVPQAVSGEALVSGTEQPPMTAKSETTEGEQLPPTETGTKGQEHDQ